MVKVIGIWNRKGGVGSTTLTAHVCFFAVELGLTVAGAGGQPSQIGLGVRFAGAEQVFNQGSFSNTGVGLADESQPGRHQYIPNAAGAVTAGRADPRSR